jgi:pyruvate formate lyase activating enzyme
MHEALLWRLEGDRVHCHLCPHSCRIADGHRGVCGVRENRGGTLYAMTYGEVSSIAVDPIEKKPVFHYHPGSTVLSLGSVGCTMRCEHCQNWQISRSKPGEHDGVADGLSHIEPAAVVDLAEKHGSLGVAFTYNEPVVWIEFVLDAAKAAKAAGLYTVMVTNGFITREGLDLIGPYIDVWRVDVKGFSDATVKGLCKVPSVEPILAQAERARNMWHMHVEVVTNVIPTINDDEEQLRGIAHWIREKLGPETPWHVTRFFPYLELSHLPPTPLPTLLRAREIGREEGLEFVYLGNIAEPGGEDTVCPECGEVAVGRDGYDVVERNLSGGACGRCGRELGIVD